MDTPLTAKELAALILHVWHDAPLSMHLPRSIAPTVRLCIGGDIAFSLLSHLDPDDGLIDAALTKLYGST